MNITIKALGLTLLCAWSACGKSKPPHGGQVAQGAHDARIGFAEERQQVERAPMELTTSDGSGLTLVSLEARAVVDDPLAFTELHLVFHNPEPRRREGRFSMRLPEAAAISRFAMRVGEQLVEGEVVERRRAQEVYEDFLHRKQDPALMEQAAGNEFAARVFPIEPNADKEIIVAYSEELGAHDLPYRLPLAGLPRLDHLKVEVLVGSASATGLESSAARAEPKRLALEKRGFAPASDLLLELPGRADVALRSGDLAVLRVTPRAKVEPEPFAGLTVLFDTSASRALGFAAQIERLGKLLAALTQQQGRDFELRVLAFDQDSEEIYRGPASRFSLRDQGKLLAREALGATDLAQALAALAARPAPHARLMIVSDGLVTAGESDATRLREAVARLAAHGLRRVDVVAEGGVRDSAGLSALTRAGLKRAGSVLDASLGAEQLATRLLRSVEEEVMIDVPGARWVYPQRLESVQAGDERLVFVELPAGAPLKLRAGGAKERTLPALEAPKALVERAWARAKIAALGGELASSGHASAEVRAQLERQIVELSTRHRVLSDRTALLVLESEDDYRRFGLARDALASILQVGDEGLELIDRREPTPAQIAWHDQPPLEEGQIVAQEPEPPTSRGASSGAQPARARREAPADDERKDRAAQAPTPEPAEKPKTANAPAPMKAEAPAGDVLAAAPAAPAPAASASAESAHAPGLGRAGGGSGAPGPDQLGGAGVQQGRLGTGAGAEVAVAAPTALEVRASVSLHSVSGLPQSTTASVLRASLTPRARACYQRGQPTPGVRERVFLEIAVTDRGSVRDAYVTSGGVADPGVKSCLLAAVRALQFPKPDAGSAELSAGVELFMAEAAAPTVASTNAAPARPRNVRVATPSLDEAYDGTLREVFTLLGRGDVRAALDTARAARERDPGDVLSLVALGEALEAAREPARAARVYGSLIDLFPARADLRRMAGARLSRLGEVGFGLAADSFAKALAQRSDHPSGHRLLAYALLRQGQHQAALDVLLAALSRGFREDRFAASSRILGEDAGLVAAALLREAPHQRPQVEALLAARGLRVAQKPSLRFVLNWETDANDVDFHIYDGRGGHASYLRPKLASGGALYADITTGYGPECFTIEGAARAYPYVLQAHYFARGPMGYGMGLLEAVEHDGKGTLRFDEHPFVIMKDKAFLELARLTGPLR
ncbi:MAG TPA: VIT domain-containing protein [Polyangiales bacterium]